MYLPDAFREERPEVLHEIIRRHSFATLVSHGNDDVLTASQLPFLFDAQRNVLRSHVARANPQWQGFAQEGEALVIFQGPHAYVSPSWYETKQAVPTWNYVTVHAYGTPRLVEGDELRRIVEDTVRQYEAAQPMPWLMPLPEEYVANMLRGVVGFEIPIARLEGKLKLNQNRRAADVAGVINALEQGEDVVGREVAAWMRRVRPLGAPSPPSP
jgi:transcriptional regulator